MTNKRILVASGDDSMVSAVSLGMKIDPLLQSIEVLTACSYDEALSKLGEEGVDLLFCDHVIQGAHGVEFASEVVERWPKTKVIFQSASSEEQTLRGRVPLFSYEFFLMPVSPEIIIRKIAKLLGIEA